jgi:hypothetical protein
MNLPSGPDPEFEEVKRVFTLMNIELSFLDHVSEAKRVQFLKAAPVIVRFAPHLLEGELEVLVDHRSVPEAEVRRVLDNAKARRRRTIQ